MAKETEGGTWVNVNGNDEKGHVNIYGSDPKEPHDESIHININYEKGTFTINEKSNGEKTSTDCSCYLTTACMRNKMSQFSDKCEELLILRWFRDKFVSKEDIEHQYEIAPIIVENITRLDNCNELYNGIYENVILLCVKAIENNEYDLAYNIYKNSILNLEEEYARPALEQKLVKVLRNRIKNINN